MQCPSCHNEVAPQSTFCGFCGAAIAAAPAGGPAVPAGYTPVGGGSAYAAAPAAVPPAAPAAGGLSENAAAAISYITIIPAIIFLVLEPYNRMRLVRFHSIQSLALAVAWIAVWICVTILHAMLHFIPFIYLLFVLVDLAISVGFLVAWLLCILKASKGEYFKLPIIGDFAEKQANS
ncbi:MAG: hypothetical protein WA869_10000 [Alloacidobacterium sp.]|jgi:uncharacterized membrane protein